MDKSLEVQVDKVDNHVQGTFRFWLQKSGSLALKLDGGKQLYTMPKDSELYNRLKGDLFIVTRGTDNDYALGYYCLWLWESRSLLMSLNAENELYSIPKETPLYERLMSDKFPDEFADK